MIKNLNKKDLLVFLFPVLLVFSEIFFRVFLGYRIVSPRAAIYSVSFGLIFGSLYFLIKSKKGLLLYFIVFSIVFNVIIITQLLYHGYFGDFYSIVRITNFKEFLSVKGETAKSFNALYLLVLLIPIIIGLAYNKFFINQNRSITKFFICLAAGLLMFFGIKTTFIDKMEDKTQVYLTDSYLYDTVFNKEKAVERFGIYTYAYRDLSNYISSLIPSNNQKEIQIIDDYFNNNKRTHTVNELTNIFEGKNLVFVICESLDNWAINEKFTPTLYKMAKEGIYGTNFYSPTFTNSTVDAEYIYNTGMVPSIDYGNNAYVFNTNSYPLSIANLFKEKGYETVAFHNNSGDFYNRYDYYDILGYDTFYDSKSLEIRVPENYGYDWPLDSELFEKTSDILIKDYKDKNFISYIMTVATHTPYDDNRIELKKNYEFVKKNLDSNSEVQYYFAAAMDLDKGIQEMIDKFDKEGILDNTVFVFVGDHYSYGMYHDLIWEYNTETKGDFHELHKVPMIIWTPNIEEPKELNQLISNFEIYPTLCNMFGLNYNPTYCFGNDIFDNKENTVLFGERHFWKDEKVFFERGTVYEKYDENVTDEYISNKNSEMVELIDIHQKVLKEDYFKNKDKE